MAGIDNGLVIAGVAALEIAATLAAGVPMIIKEGRREKARREQERARRTTKPLPENQNQNPQP